MSAEDERALKRVVVEFLRRQEERSTVIVDHHQDDMELYLALFPILASIALHQARQVVKHAVD